MTADGGSCDTNNPPATHSSVPLPWPETTLTRYTVSCIEASATAAAHGTMGLSNSAEEMKCYNDEPRLSSYAQ